MALFLKVDWQVYEAAKERGQEWSYGLWLLVRALSDSGSVSLEKLEAVAVEHRLFAGHGKRNVKRHVKRGIEAGWYSERPATNGPRLAYVGKVTVCKMLGVGKLNGAAVKVPVTSLRRLQTFRAAMEDVWHRRHGKRPIYRQSIEAATGISRASQWRYEKLNGIKVQKQVSIAPYQEGDVIANGKGGNPSRGEYTYSDKRGTVWHAKPMAPVYTSGLGLCKSGRQRKVNRELDHKARGEAKRLPDTARVTCGKLYHGAFKAARKALAEHGHTTYARLGFTHHGRGVWYRYAAA